MLRRAIIAAIVVLGSWSAQPTAGQHTAAQPATTHRVLIRVDPDSELAQRIRGQTADLGWNVRFVVPLTQWPASDGALPQAAELTRTEGASTVVWLEPGPEHTIKLAAYDVPSQAFWVRTLTPTDGDRWARSTRHEAAALIIRGTLSTLAVERDAVRSDPRTVPHPSARPTDAEVPIAPPSTPRPPSNRMLFAAGWELGADGLTTLPHHAMRLALGWQTATWQAHIEGSLGLTTEADDRRSRIALQRRRLRLVVSPVHLQTGDLSMRPGLSTGMWQMTRQTRAVQDGWQSTPNGSLWGPLFGADIALRWPASDPPRGLSLELRMGLDVVFHAASLLYAGTRGSETRERAWYIQPRIALGLVLAP